MYHHWLYLLCGWAKDAIFFRFCFRRFVIFVDDVVVVFLFVSWCCVCITDAPQANRLLFIAASITGRAHLPCNVPPSPKQILSLLSSPFEVLTCNSPLQSLVRASAISCVIISRFCVLRRTRRVEVVEVHSFLSRILTRPLRTASNASSVKSC